MEDEYHLEEKNVSGKNGLKTFVLDTNVLMHNEESILTFGKHNVYIPITVIEELDNMKTGHGLKPYSARKALRKITSYTDSKEYSAEKGISLPSGGIMKVVTGEDNFFGENKADNLIISCAMKLQEGGLPDVIIVSKDSAVRIKAISKGLLAEDYEYDKTRIFQNYGKILQEDDYNNGILSVRYQKKEKEIVRLWNVGDSETIKRGRRVYDVLPKNAEQECVLDALMNPYIKVVALTGKAGTGKTFLALAAALSQVTRKDSLFDKIIVARPPVPMGYDMGFLPGDESEKIDPWMRPIYDNLDILLKTNKDVGENKKMKGGNYKSWQYLIEDGAIEIESLTYIRGRNFPRCYVIIDEAQNLRPLDVKTITTRLAEGSKIVFCGDLDQIDTPYLDAESNGHAYLIGKLIQESFFCYLELQESVRSQFAHRMAELL